jgi:hypothetical protein
MLLIPSSPRQFINYLALLNVLFWFCACGNQDVSRYSPTSPSIISAQMPGPSNTPAVRATQTVLASASFVQPGASSHRVNGEPSWLVNGLLREDARMNRRSLRLSQATLVDALHAPIKIAIFPTRATLALNHSLQFRAGIKGKNNQALKWLVEGHEGGDASVGTISATGVYTAPPRPTPWPSVTITAVSAYASEFLGSAVVMIEPARRTTSSRASHWQHPSGAVWVGES